MVVWFYYQETPKGSRNGKQGGHFPETKDIFCPPKCHFASSRIFSAHFHGLWVPSVISTDWVNSHHWTVMVAKGPSYVDTSTKIILIATGWLGQPWWQWPCFQSGQANSSTLTKQSRAEQGCCCSWASHSPHQSPVSKWPLPHQWEPSGWRGKAEPRSHSRAVLHSAHCWACLHKAISCFPFQKERCQSLEADVFIKKCISKPDMRSAASGAAEKLCQHLGESKPAGPAGDQAGPQPCQKLQEELKPNKPFPCPLFSI